MLQHLQFALRRRVLGPIRLRPGLPRLSPRDIHQGELNYYRTLVSAGMAPEQRDAITLVLDVGCRNWSYVRALSDSFVHAQLMGFEVDGYRRYWNMWRRIDYARAHGLALPQPARAILGDFRNQLLQPPPNGVTLLCFLFPFLTPYPCKRWGLPPRFANYRDLVQHGLTLTQQAPVRWLCVHQGDWEAEAAQEIYAELGMTMEYTRLTPDAWADDWHSPHDNWVFTSQRLALNGRQY